jgi:putative transposase
LPRLSNGEKIQAQRTYRKYEQKLGIAQRARNKKRVKAIHAKIKHIRIITYTKKVQN